MGDYMKNKISKENYSVYGKEFVISKSVIKKFLRSEFDRPVNIQDIWLEDGNVCFRIAGIGPKNGDKALDNLGFKLVHQSHRYEASENLDKKFEQLFQERNILNYSW